MKNFFLRLAASLLIVPASITVAAESKSSVEIVNAEFGLFDASNPREIVFEPGTVVPRKNGQRYGWVIDVRTRKRSLIVREAYVQATPNEITRTTSEQGELITIPIQRRHEVSQRQLVPVKGKIYGEWAIGPDEPAGHRHLQVSIDDSAVADFEYDVR